MTLDFSQLKVPLVAVVGIVGVTFGIYEHLNSIHASQSQVALVEARQEADKVELIQAQIEAEKRRLLDSLSDKQESEARILKFYMDRLRAGETLTEAELARVESTEAKIKELNVQMKKLNNSLLREDQ